MKSFDNTFMLYLIEDVHYNNVCICIPTKFGNSIFTK